MATKTFITVSEFRAELHPIRFSIEELNKRVDQLGTRVDQLDKRVDQLDKRVDQLDKRVDQLDKRVEQLDKRVDRLDRKFTTEIREVKLATLQMAARARNSNLKNPTLLLRAIPILDPDRGIVEPDPASFPRHANEFYGLRNPSTERARRQLTYLITFYDVVHEAPLSDGSSESSEASEPEQEMQLHPERAVELLENILGLQEENFVAFRERARHFASRPVPDRPTKREQSLRSKEEPRQRRKVKSSPSDGSPTNLNTPTPPGGRPPRRPVAMFPMHPAAPASSLPPVSSRDGITTNPNTPPVDTSKPKSTSSAPRPASEDSIPDTQGPYLSGTQTSMPDTEAP